MVIADTNLTIGDATEMELPRADTVVLCNILERVDDPISLLRKALGLPGKTQS
jgi:hypothetical protein